MLYVDPIVAVLPRDHHLTKRTLSVKDLAAEQFVLCERRVTPTLFDNILGLCTSAGFSPEIVNTSATWAGVLTLVESGAGVSLVPGGVRHLRTRGVVFRALRPETVNVGLSAVWNPENEGVIQQDFLKLVRANKERIHNSGGN